MLHIVGGDTHVPAVEAVGEGMLRFADAAIGSVDAHHFHQLIGEMPLSLHGIILVQEIRARFRSFGNRQNQGRELLAQGIEIGIEHIHRRALFELIQQHVIDRLFIVFIRGKAAGVVHQLFQVRCEGGKVAVQLSLMPHRVRVVEQPGKLHVLVHGNAGELVIAFQ